MVVGWVFLDIAGYQTRWGTCVAKDVPCTGIAWRHFRSMVTGVLPGQADRAEMKGKEMHLGCELEEDPHEPPTPALWRGGLLSFGWATL